MVPQETEEDAGGVSQPPFVGEQEGPVGHPEAVQDWEEEPEQDAPLPDGRGLVQERYWIPAVEESDVLMVQLQAPQLDHPPSLL